MRVFTVPFQMFCCSRKFSDRTTQKVVFHLLSNRIFRKILVNGNNRSYRRSLLSPFPPSFARTLTYEEFDSVTFAYNALHPVIMSPIPVIDISPLWTLCDTGKLFIFLIARQSLRFQSRIDGEMVPCH